MTEQPLKLIIITGFPGSGKTTLATKLATAMNKSRQPTAVIEQGLVESFREETRNLCKRIGAAGNPELIAERDQIMQTSRLNFLETLAVSAFKQLEVGCNVVMPANLRFPTADKIGDLYLYDFIINEAGRYIDRPVELITLHIKADPDENVRRLEQRLEGLDTETRRYFLGENIERTKQMAKAYKECGPAYVYKRGALYNSSTYETEAFSLHTPTETVVNECMKLFEAPRGRIIHPDKTRPEMVCVSSILIPDVFPKPKPL